MKLTFGIELASIVFDKPSKELRTLLTESFGLTLVKQYNNFVTSDTLYERLTVKEKEKELYQFSKFY